MEDLGLKTDIIDQFAFKAINRDKLMRLLVYLMKGETSFNCYVMDINDVPLFMKLFALLAKEGLTLRLQLIVRNDVHYSGADLEIINGEICACVMDSAGPLEIDSINKLINILKEYKSVIDLIGGEDFIQFDTYNCAFYIIESLIQSSQNKSLFSDLKKIRKFTEDGVSHILWKDLPPNFIENTTSVSFMRTYFSELSMITLEREYEICKTFSDYIPQTKTILITKKMTMEMRPVNTVILKKIEKYSRTAKRALGEFCDQFLSSIVSAYPIDNLIHHIQKIRK